MQMNSFVWIQLKYSETKNIVFYHKMLWGPRVEFDAGKTQIPVLNLFQKGESISIQLQRATGVVHRCLCGT